MNRQHIVTAILFILAAALPIFAAPSIDPIPAVSLPAGKSLILPVTANSPNGRPLMFTAASSTNGITVEIHTNNPFWKMSVAQVAAPNAPGAFQTPFRGGIVTVTNIGDMTFMLLRDTAPHTVDVVQGLTAGGFYTSNTIFHRVVPGFVIQGGDPNTNGSGGPVFRYDDEFNPNALFSGNGQLALANAGKDSDGSQFFITAGPQRALDFGYTIFGQLLRGFEVLTNVINTPADTNSRPLADVIITRASFVPDNFDTVLTLSGTNLAGISGTIMVMADDGAGGRTTNSFTASTLTNVVNDPPFLYPNIVTNFVVPMNGRLTNFVSALDLEGDSIYWFKYYADLNSSLNASNTTFSIVNGQLQIVIIPNTNYVGPVGFRIVVSSSSHWSFLPTLYPYDSQVYSFGIGDTPVVAQATNLTAYSLTAFTNQLMATFTNGVPNSAVTNFTAYINWGDDSTNSGIIVTNLLNQKEVLGAHTYTNAGTYPVYIKIQSSLGAAATVIATASVPPSLSLITAGGNSLVTWPAWATDYQLYSAGDLAGSAWQVVSNYSALIGYNCVVTNSPTNAAGFFRLKK